MIAHPSLLPDEPLSSQPVTGFVIERASELADKPAVIDGPGEWSLTFGQLEKSVYSLAGGAVTTVNPTYGTEEIAYQLTDSGAKLVFAADGFTAPAVEAMDQAGVAGDVVVVDSENPSAGVPMQSLMGDPIRQVEVDPHEDVVVLPHSSGPLGCPKG